MRSVLLSIHPKWCELIASGKKTIEIRKTRPKLEPPFKCYIYCTNKNLILYGEMCLGEIGRQNLHISADIIATMPKGYGTYSTVKLSVNLCVMKLL